MRWAISIILLTICSGAFSQQSVDSRFFFDGLTECGASLGGWKCLELDLTSEASIENDSTKVYEYSWNFGDGNRKQGTKIEHCYDQFGSYQVTMDLIDTETNTVIRNELSSTVQLYPEIFPVISTSTEDLPPGFVAFSCSYNDRDLFEPDRIYWRVDGAYYEGNTITHPFPVAGVFLVEMGMEKDTDLFGTIAACSHTEITIKASDVWTTDITGFFERARKEANTGPFAGGDVICFFRTLTGEYKDNVALIPLNRLMQQVQLAEGEQYELMLLAGNAFTRKKHLNTHGLNGNDLYSALKDSVSSFLHQPLVFLPSVTMAPNQPSGAEDVPGLNQTAELLLKYDFLTIEIGAYLYTGSRTVKGIETALKRAEMVRRLLVAYGVDSQRLSVASGQFNRALMNTCGALPDCEWENESLNGVVEFKITGTKL